MGGSDGLLEIEVMRERDFELGVLDTAYNTRKNEMTQLTNGCTALVLDVMVMVRVHTSELRFCIVVTL